MNSVKKVQKIRKDGNKVLGLIREIVIDKDETVLGEIQNKKKIRDNRGYSADEEYKGKDSDIEKGESGESGESEVKNGREDEKGEKGKQKERSNQKEKGTLLVAQFQNGQRQFNSKEGSCQCVQRKFI